ncbi:aminopeptidase P family protein [Flavimaricola marinus]|uniref:Xaa-Pro dipeptidase n=1 Tax=Flavimaricola marinus TaxID=1819565 RepID=A0A238LDS5_9RHOB|nr:aminopeptidase P family protein [Flavimaricola marinus]SMY07732.1 Xaa-Pro dipeptidase [Flavimaricola marinus]
MFQTFEVTSRPEQGPPRLAALRRAMVEQGLDTLIVPREDAFQGEYVAPCDERLKWLTGFTGSAGFAVVTRDVAGVFVDGRYRVQVCSQVAPEFTPVNWPEVNLADWLTKHLTSGAVVGFDPWLHTVKAIADLEAKLAPAGITLRPGPNLIDPLWEDRPAPPKPPFSAYPIENAGEPHAEKRARLAKSLRDAGQPAAVLTLPDSIAWLLNIRGADIERNPVPQCYAILYDDAKVLLFAHPGKTDVIVQHLGPDVTTHPIDQFEAALAGLFGPVRLDPASAPEAVRAILEAAGTDIARAQDPCSLPKACKNPVELEGARAAHLRDGAAMVQFLAWLDAEAPKGGLTEIAVVEALEGFRRATNALRDISFETICGAGEHGAIVHYRVTEDTDRPVRNGELLLVDSGGQYLDGTTDITRTIAVGPPPEDAAESYTAVLQGMIAISRARFPRGVTGGHLDSLARFPLWTLGRDYDHGTGHGVGAYLSVHEGPQRLSRISDVPLDEGMILSNEPGYYREGAFGIRIENLIAVIAAPKISGGDDRDMLAFETLTWVPFDRRLILTDRLSPQERDWINWYHAATLQHIGPRVDDATLIWLTQACAAL